MTKVVEKFNHLKFTTKCFQRSFCPTGPTNVLYEINGCQDTININVINTEILIGNYDICQNEGIQNLNNVPVSYAGGSWSGPGAIQINNNYFFIRDIYNITGTTSF